jgi:hypothetical protein
LGDTRSPSPFGGLNAVAGPDLDALLSAPANPGLNTKLPPADSSGPSLTSPSSALLADARLSDADTLAGDVAKGRLAIAPQGADTDAIDQVFAQDDLFEVLNSGDVR